jgi:hypothetical protein
MPDTTVLIPWLTPALDAVLVALLAFALGPLRRDPTASWQEREAKVGEMLTELKTLVARADGAARDFDRRLAAREERIRALLADVEETPPVAAAVPPATPGTAATAKGKMAHIQALAGAGRSADEIARAVDVPPAEVRVLLALAAARAAESRSRVSGRQK